jgi:hypothetical protein
LLRVSSNELTKYKPNIKSARIFVGRLKPSN